MDQVRLFLEVQQKEYNDKVRCSVCKVSLATNSKEDDVCYCITCVRSFLLRLLVRHMNERAHLKYQHEGNVQLMALRTLLFP